MRKRLYIMIAAMVALFFTAACVSTPSTAVPTTAAVPSPKPAAIDTSPVTIRYGEITGVPSPTLIVVEGQGFLAKENITLEKYGFNGAGPVADALAAGNLDMGTTSPVPAMLASAKGAKTILIAGFEDAFVEKNGQAWEPLFVVVRSGEGIQKLTDLKGKKVAVTDIGSYSNYALRASMIDSKIDPDKDMVIVPVPSTQMPAALMQKQVDVIVCSADSYVQVQTMGKVDAIANDTSLVGLDLDVSTTLAVNTDYLQAKPDVAVRFLRAFIQARQWMAADIVKNKGQNIIDLIAKAMKYTPEKATALYNTRGGYYGRELDLINLLDIPVRSVNRYYEILRINAFIKPEIPSDYAKVVDIRPLEQAYATMGLVWDAGKH
ncbi:MAG TPA: ABC transporter substrate-binding protein [Anaerolineae bacterium]